MNYENKCKICGREFVSLCSLSNHISRSHKIKIENYYLKYINPEKGKCDECENNTLFINLRDGYKKYCCVKCLSNSYEVKNKRKETCKKKYGFENPSQVDEFKDKKKEQSIKKYGVDNPMQSDEVQNKYKETCKERFGCEYPSQNEEVKIKQKETCVKNFGFEYALQNKVSINKFKKTCKERFGFDHPSQNKEIQNKQKETCVKNHGCEHALQNKEIQNKFKQTCMIKFGCEHPLQNKEISEKLKLNFQKVQKRYPDLIICEELISGPNDEVLGHCKNSNCKNSKENGGYFELTTYQIQYRNSGIAVVGDLNYFYCCEECKNSCPLFHRSATALSNLISEDLEINYTSEEYSSFRNEVFARQLQENKEHLENYCEKCHSIENLTIHHIQPQKLEPGYVLDPPNGIVLCQKCHYEIGHKTGTECSTGNLANKLCK